MIKREADNQDYRRLQEEGENNRLAEILRSEQLAQEEERRRAEDERKRARKAEQPQRFDTDAERAFREEAEQVPTREHAQGLLENWLGWKAHELEIQAGALNQRAADREREGRKYREYQETVYETATKLTGSSYRREMELMAKMSDKAQAEEVAALKLKEDAQDADLAFQYYSTLGSNSAEVKVLASSARGSRRSFQDVVNAGLATVLKQAHGERRTRRQIGAFWKWTRRVTVALVLLAAIVLAAIGSRHSGQ